MFRIGVFLVLFTVLIFLGWYYSLLIKRFLEIIRRKKYNKLFVFSYKFLGYFLAFCTINIFSSLGIFLLHFFIFSLVMELIHVLIPKFFLKNDIGIKIYKSSIIPLLVTLVFFSYGYMNIRHVVKTEYTVFTEKKLEDLHILFLSDSHYGTVLKKEKLEKIKEEINHLDIDLILLGGDIVDENTTKEQMKEVFSILGSMKNTKGIYFVYGNHDRQNYARDKKFTVEELELTLKQNHINALSDESQIIEENLVVVGREDLSSKRKSSKELLKDIEDKKFIILLDHQPKGYKENASLGVDLMLSGHTHAGQIFPAGHIIRLFSMADLWYGQLKVEKMEAIVSSGLSGWGYPIRTQKNSEYVVIHVKQQDK